MRELAGGLGSTAYGTSWRASRSQRPPAQAARSTGTDSVSPPPPIGIQPSAYSLMCAKSFGPAAPPTSVRGPTTGPRGFCTGLGVRHGWAVREPTRPRSRSVRRPHCPHQGASGRRTSSRRVRQSDATRSAAVRRHVPQPKPRPRVKRPPERWSRVAICLARATGSCWATRVIPVPSASRLGDRRRLAERDERVEGPAVLGRQFTARRVRGDPLHGYVRVLGQIEPGEAALLQLTSEQRAGVIVSSVRKIVTEMRMARSLPARAPTVHADR